MVTLGPSGPASPAAPAPGVPRDLDRERRGPARRGRRGARWVNSPWDGSYFSLLATPISVGVGRSRRGRGPPLLDQRRSDGPLLPRRRSRDQARAHHRRASPPARRAAPDGRGRDRDGRSCAAVPGGRRRWARAPAAGGSRWRRTSPSRWACWRSRPARTPSGLRPLLLAIAIVDDIGSVIVVAAFSPGAIAVGWLRRVRRRRRAGLRLREAPHPGDPRVRHPRDRALVRDVSRGGPSRARRSRGRTPDTVGALPATSRPIAPRATEELSRRSRRSGRARPAAVDELRRPAGVRARERRRPLVGHGDRRGRRQRRRLGDPDRPGRRQDRRHRGRRARRIQARAGRSAPRRRVDASRRHGGGGRHRIHGLALRRRGRLRS